MKTLMLSLLVLLAACGKNSIDPQLQPYLDSFVVAGNITGNLTPNGLTMRFGSIAAATDADGDCQWALGGNTITIDPTYFADYTEIQRTLLVWHELGHCALGRQHNNSINPVTGYPVSIMYYESTASAIPYAQNPLPYDTELFNP